MSTHKNKFWNDLCTAWPCRWSNRQPTSLHKLSDFIVCQTLFELNSVIIIRWIFKTDYLHFKNNAWQLAVLSCIKTIYTWTLFDRVSILNFQIAQDQI
jgi:hypothetical protein